MKRITVATISLLALAIVFGGCGVRGQVAKEKVIQRIDSMLGTMDVKRKEIETSFASLEDAMHGLRKAKIKAQVKQDQISRKSELAAVHVGQLDETLRTLRTRLTGDVKAPVNGRTYSSAEIAGMTQQVIAERQDAVKQRDGFQLAISRLSKVVGTLESKQSHYESKLSEIQHQLTVIDSNRIALTAMQDAAAVMNDSDKSFANNVAQLEDKVNDLFADVEAGLMIENIHWQDGEASTIDQIVAAMQSPDDLVSKIDAILPDSHLAESESQLAENVR